LACEESRKKKKRREGEEEQNRHLELYGSVEDRRLTISLLPRQRSRVTGSRKGKKTQEEIPNQEELGECRPPEQQISRPGEGEGSMSPFPVGKPRRRLASPYYQTQKRG